MAQTAESTGVVVRMLRDKGFGFIKEDRTGMELFFHQSAVRRGGFEQLVEAQSRVSFEKGEGPKGPRAENVQLL